MRNLDGILVLNKKYLSLTNADYENACSSKINLNGLIGAAIKESC